MLNYDIINGEFIFNLKIIGPVVVLYHRLPPLVRSHGVVVDVC